MTTPNALADILVGALYPILAAVIAVGLKVNRNLTTFKIYLRQVCAKLDIKCGKDLD